MASKISQSYIINDAVVQDFMASLDISDEPSFAIPDAAIHTVADGIGPVETIVAIDGGYKEIPVRRQFPSASMAFMQYGALFFGLEDLENLENSPFISPEDMSKLTQMERFKLVLPVRGIRQRNGGTLVNSVRTLLYDYLQTAPEKTTFMDALCWLVFAQYSSQPREIWSLSTCPNPDCDAKAIPLRLSEMSADHKFRCPTCGSDIFLSDVLRLHEAMDNEFGAGGILGYLITTLEQITLVYVIKAMMAKQPEMLRRVLFVKDGPLAFFGQTANLHAPMRDLVSYLWDNYDCLLVGLEKSGQFVEHADAIGSLLNPGSAFLLPNDYIYKYIIPGASAPNQVYGNTTYYGQKVIYRSLRGGLYVATIPTRRSLANPTVADVPHLDVILSCVDRLKCDMYDNALLPIALVNHLVSLADHPSSAILERFARSSLTPKRTA